MKLTELVDALNHMKVQTGSIVCLGCGHENSCSTRGCAILREVADQLDAYAGPFGEQAVLMLAAQVLDSTPKGLRELTQAQKDGRLFMPPVKVGDMLWPVCWDRVAKAWVIDDKPERVNEVGSKGFFVAYCTADPEAPDEFHPYEEIGKEYFVSREDAEVAVVKMEVQGE